MILGRSTKVSTGDHTFSVSFPEKPFFLVFNCQIFSIMFKHCEKLLNVKTLSTENNSTF